MEANIDVVELVAAAVGIVAMVVGGARKAAVKMPEVLTANKSR